MSSGVQKEDKTFTKIFVGGLPYHTTDQSLREFFEQFGAIEEAVVITDRQTAKSRGYGFVTMSDQAAAELACKDPNPIIDGRKANVNLAYLGAKPRIPAGESTILAGESTFPYALQAGIPGYLGGAQYARLPQYIYPPAYMTSQAGLTLPMSPQSPPSPPTGGATQLYDYAAAGYQVAQLPAGYAQSAAGYPFASTAGYMAPSAAYPYATVPQNIAAYQLQILQQRMQRITEARRIADYTSRENDSLIGEYQ